MSKYNHTSSKAMFAFSNVAHNLKKRKSGSNKKSPLNKSMFQKLSHPDYILFDWEYFSRELEFE